VLRLVRIMVHSVTTHTVPMVQASKVSGLSPLHTSSPLSYMQWVSMITTIFAVLWLLRNSTAQLASTQPPYFFLLIRPVVEPSSGMSKNAIYPMCQYHTMAQGMGTYIVVAIEVIGPHQLTEDACKPSPCFMPRQSNNEKWWAISVVYISLFWQALWVGNVIAVSFLTLISLYTLSNLFYTGGKGSLTQWVRCGYIVGSGAIRPHYTQQVHGECYRACSFNTAFAQLFYFTKSNSHSIHFIPFSFHMFISISHMFFFRLIYAYYVSSLHTHFIFPFSQ